MLPVRQNNHPCWKVRAELHKQPEVCGLCPPRSVCLRFPPTSVRHWGRVGHFPMVSKMTRSLKNTLLTNTRHTSTLRRTFPIFTQVSCKNLYETDQLKLYTPERKKKDKSASWGRKHCMCNLPLIWAMIWIWSSETRHYSGGVP